MGSSSIVSIATALVLIVGAAACQATASPSSDVCEGVPADFGGCEQGQPAYAGTTCEEVGREFGVHLAERAQPIVSGAAVPDDLSQASALLELRILLAVRANQHLRERGIVDECDAGDFVGAAERELSTELRAELGRFLWDGPPASYEEWRAELLRTMRIIDQDEDLPF